MTKRIGNKVIIMAEEADECTMCHEMKELRPAGVNGARVCFACAQKNSKAIQEYSERLFGRKQ